MTTTVSPKKLIFGAGIILILSLVVYLPAIQGGFIWDDDKFLTENPIIRAGDGLYRFWFTTEPPDYFPLTSTTLWFEWRLWGMNATGYHAVNVLLHVISSVLIWLVLKRLKVPGAWLAGLIFAVHPVNVESVAWITERKNTLPLVFHMLTILLFLKFESEERPRLYVWSLIAFLLALLAKTSVVMLPVVLLLCAWWQRREISGKDILRTIPFFALSAMLSLVTIWFQYNRAIRSEIVRNDDFFSRLAGAGQSVWFYLYKAVFPYELSFVYPKWDINASSFLSYVPGLLILLLMFACWRYRGKWGRPVLFALTYFVITLFPVLGFFNIYFMKYALVADHWQYISLIGIVGLLTGLAAHAYQTGQKSLRHVLMISAVVIVGLLSFKSWTQAHIYKNQETLWTDTVAKNPDSRLALNNLGAIRKQQRKLDEAARLFSRAVKHDAAAEAHYNLGAIREEQGQLDAATRHYSDVLKINPNELDTHNNMGDILVRQKRFKEALEHYSQVLRVKPHNTDIRNKMGMLLGQMGKHEEAMGHFAEILKISSENASAHYNMGFSLARQKKFDEALKSYAEAIRISPDFERAHYQTGLVMTRKGDMEKAVQHFSQVLRINPDAVKVHYNMGAALRHMGKTEEAVTHFSRAAELRPDYLKAHYILGIIFQEQGKTEDARRHYAEVLRINPEFEEGGGVKLRDRVEALSVEKPVETEGAEQE